MSPVFIKVSSFQGVLIGEVHCIMFLFPHSALASSKVLPIAWLLCHLRQPWQQDLPLAGLQDHEHSTESLPHVSQTTEEEVYTVAVHIYMCSELTVPWSNL